MSSIPQVSPGVDTTRHPAKIRANFAAGVPGLLPDPKFKILLVGRNTSWGAPLQSRLKQIGCDLSFAPSLRVTSAFIERGSYAAILLDSSVPLSKRNQLLADLLGSGTSVFLLFPVENGCWWLPVLHSGEACFGSPGFRTKEFSSELVHILQERR